VRRALAIRYATGALACGLALAPGTRPAAAAPEGKAVEAPEGVVRPIAPLYEPSVADTILPFHAQYREIVPEQKLTVRLGALRQGRPDRRYSGIQPGAAVRVPVDGGTGGSHLAIVTLLPWIDRVAPSVACPVDLLVRVNGEDEQRTTLWFTPGPVLFSARGEMLPVSTPGLVTIPLPPGRGFVEFKYAKTPASYLLFQLGVPELMPLPVMPGG
jgi:hypothetical protein